MENRLIQAMKTRDPIIIFGCTELGAEIYAELRLLRDNISTFFYDNDIAKQKQGYCNVAVLNREELKEKIQSSYFIIAGLNSYEEMYDQLIRFGVREEHIIFPEAVLKKKISSLQKQVETYEEIIRKRTPRKKLGFVVDLAEHCNLNCQGCDHFSPLAKPFFTDINDFKNDLVRMHELFGDNITSVALEGGEPLLNSKVDEFVYMTRKIFESAKIQIFTNGILLPKMKEEFWEACKVCEAVLEVTKYPIDFNYDEVRRQAEERGVRLQYYSGGDEEKTSMYKPLDIEGRQDKYDNYHKCWNANSDCVMLKKGKLYTCTRIPNLETFNCFFHQNLQVTDKDYIDIYADITAEEIFEFLSNPMPACRYCRIGDWTGGFKWGITKKSIAEWT